MKLTSEETQCLRTGVVALLLSILMLISGGTRAEVGPAATGLAGRANDASTVFFSPAGMTRLDETQHLIQTAFIYNDTKFRVEDATFDGGNADNDNPLLVVPGAYYVRKLSDRWRLGFSINVPSGLGHDYGKTWSGRYLAEESNLAFVALTSAVAYQLTDNFSVAAGPYGMYVESKTKARVNNLLPDFPDGSIRLEETGSDIGFILGAMYEFSDDNRIGFSYRSKLKPELEGTPSFSNLDPLLREALAALDLLGTEVDLDFTVPDQAQVGLNIGLSDRWSATADVMWINTSQFGMTRVSVGEADITVREGDFRDAWLMSSGLKFEYEKHHSFSIGATYVTSAVSDGKRSLALPMDRIYGFGVGHGRPCFGFQCTINLNYFDLGDGNLTEDGGVLNGSVSGEFSKNRGVMLEFQLGSLLN